MSNQPVTYEASNQASPLNLEEEYINIAEIEFEFDVFKDEKKISQTY